MNLFKGFSVLVMVALLSACGSSSTRQSSTSSSGSSSGGGGGGSITTGTGNIYNLPAAPEFVANISGLNGPAPSYIFGDSATESLSTSQTLRVKVTARAAPNLTVQPYTNWVFPYGCMRVRVSVNGTTQSTQLLKVADVTQGSNSVCANAPTSQILDFSNAMSGSGAVVVTIDNPEYDNCRYTWPLTYGCSMSAVWMNHMVSASIAVQVDGTWLE